MKKLYLPLLVLAFATALVSQRANAQNACPPGLPPIANAVNINNSFCVVYADHLWPNGVVILLDINLQPIAAGTADPTGSFLFSIHVTRLHTGSPPACPGLVAATCWYLRRHFFQ